MSETIQRDIQSVEALHDFDPPPGPGSSTCLGFRAGQVLRVLNKDASGWWDGQLDCKRGWFPSTYVAIRNEDSMCTATPTLTRPQARTLHLDPKEHKPAAESTDLARKSCRVGIHVRQNEAVDMDSIGAVESAIGLLQHAIEAEVIAYFQPATACIISSIRAILLSTQCLTRESAILGRHPDLARERKQILSTLASLVTQARKSSNIDMAGHSRKAETELMMRLSQRVLVKTRQFLSMAQRCIAMAHCDCETAAESPTLGSIFISKARSTGSLRTPQNSKQTASSATNFPDVGKHSNRILEAYTTAEGSLRNRVQILSLQKGRFSPVAFGRIEKLSSGHDQLLSLVAAFIGHVHAHSRMPHASSHAHLIDMTREIIEHVRGALILVDASHQPPQSLTNARACMYNSACDLVAATQQAISSRPCNPKDTEEKEKLGLLSAATSVLRSSNALVVAAAAAAAAPAAAHRCDHAGAGNVILDHGTQPSADFQNPPLGREAEARRTLSSLDRLASNLIYPLDHGHADCGVDQIDGGDNPHQRKAELSNEVSGTVGGPPFAAPPPPLHIIANPRLGTEYAAPLIYFKNAEISGSVRTNSTAMHTAEKITQSPLFENCSSEDLQSCSHAESQTSPYSKAGSDEQPRSSYSSLESYASDENVSRVASRQHCREQPPVLSNGQKDRREIAFSPNGAVVGGTLAALVERLTLHDTVVDGDFSSSFLMTFRLFTNPVELCNTLIARFCVIWPQDQGLAASTYQQWQGDKLVSVQLRVLNVFKAWLDTFWREDTDEVVLKPLEAFAREKLKQDTSSAGIQRLLDAIERRQSRGPLQGASSAPHLRRTASTSLLRSARENSRPGNALLSSTIPLKASPPPLISRGLSAALRNPLTASTVTVMDIDPLELSRQMTLLASRTFCSIRAEELLGQEFSKGKSSLATNVKRMSILSTRITGWILEMLLSEDDGRKRTQLLKYFIKLADRCRTLQNYDTLMAILAALNSSTITRLRRTWDGLAPKYHTILESVRRATDHIRNYADYRAMLRSAEPPCLPFLGLCLTDLTFCCEGNSTTRSSPTDPTLQIINFDRYQRIARIVNEIQRFQVPYEFIEVPGILSWIQHCLACLKSGIDADELYKRSLTIEPKSTDASGSANSPSLPFAKSWALNDLSWSSTAKKLASTSALRGDPLR